MPPIIEYELPKDYAKNLNLFPEIVIAGHTIFHGTCEIYANDIGNNGFVRGYTPFESDQLQLLIDILTRIKLPSGNDSVKPLSQRISNYLMRRSTAPLSFTFSAYESIYYACEGRRGGQIFMAISDATKMIRENGISLSQEEINLINELERRIAEVLNSRGAVYAISVEDNLRKKLEHQDALNDVAKAFDAASFIGNSIPVENIKGVIFIPNDFTPNNELIVSAAADIKNKSATDTKSLVFQLKRSRFQQFNEE